MVRAQAYRQKKYQAKIDPDVVRARFSAQRDVMAEQTSARFADLASVEQSVKSVIEPAGVPTITIPFYLNFGRELYSLSNKFSGVTLANEAKLKYEKWKAKGLTANLLKQIAELFGIDTTNWT